MARKKIPKASKKRLVVFGTISIIIIVYFLFILCYYIYSIYDKKQEKEQLDLAYKELKTEEKILKTEIEKLQDEDYIARFARENYSYSKDGEYILKINDTEKKQKENKKIDFHIEYNYIIYGGAILLLVIIFHTIKKRN